jgi:hypothetical protein
MSTTIDQAFVKQYEKDVHDAYQRRGSKLRMTVRRKDNVVGSSTTFQTVGKGVATQKTRNGVITPMNVSHSPVECALADYYAGDWVDKLDETKTNLDERRVLVNAGAYALGRKTDELIIAQLDATTNNVAAGGTGMTLAKVLSGMNTLGDADVFEEGRMHAIVPWNEWTDLLQIDQFASADFIPNDKKPFVEGVESRFWLGTLWMPHSGLEALVSGGVSKSYWYHEDSVGCASGEDVTADVTWHGDRQAFFVNNRMSMGAKLIDAAGVIEIQCTRP